MENEIIKRKDGLTIKFRDDLKSLNKGIKEFEIEGIKIYAINKKNAERKAGKLK